MATKLPKISGANNYGAQSPIKDIGQIAQGNGGVIKTTRVPASATYAGHGQVNPGSSKGNVGSPSLQTGTPAVKHSAQATQVGKKETSNSR